MEYSEDDVVHKMPHKMKTHWQNLLKISVGVEFKIHNLIRYNQVGVILVQCPFNIFEIFL